MRAVLEFLHPREFKIAVVIYYITVAPAVLSFAGCMGNVYFLNTDPGSDLGRPGGIVHYPGSLGLWPAHTLVITAYDASVGFLNALRVKKYFGHYMNKTSSFYGT